MYATLPPKRLLAILGYPLLAIFLLQIFARGLPAEASSVWRLAGTTIAIWSFILLAFWGMHVWWSPWRLLWRAIPQLNRWVFPDLNGTWKGFTKSNWPSIKAMLDTVDGKRSDVTRDDLSVIPLQSDKIAITIKASFFSFVVEAGLSSTGGTSHSVTERVCYDAKRERFELYYVYLQDTPIPQPTDESSHPGAAKLVLNMDDWSLRGEYWTKRSWRQGLNTAGMIEVVRQSR